MSCGPVRKFVAPRGRPRGPAHALQKIDMQYTQMNIQIYPNALEHNTLADKVAEEGNFSLVGTHELLNRAILCLLVSCTR